MTHGLRPQICATVTGPSMAALREARDGASGADLVEVRLDTVDRPDVSGAMHGRRRPVVVTCRAAWEGGHFGGSEEERARLLAEALDAGAEWVDVEWQARFRDDLIARAPGRVVVSHHDFEGVPGDVEARLAAMRATGAGVVKMAVMASRLSDTVEVAPIAEEHGRDGGQVFVVMGMPGIVSRVMPTRFGSQWTYAGEAVAPGQVPLDRMVHEFRVRDVTRETRLFGVVGRPIGHSRSPVMHNAAFAARGIDAVYVPCEADTFDDFLVFAEAFGVEGCSVTAPFKQEARAVSSVTAARVDALGAANTLRRIAGGWEARNTDVDGFLAPLSGESLAGGHAAVLGAGGAARAVVVALKDLGMRVVIHARDAARGQRLAQEFGVDAGEWPAPPEGWDVLVNTTPVGTWPDVDQSPMPDLGRGGALVYDLVYNPRETRLLADACSAGHRVIGGLDMLVAQAERQWAWWMGEPPPSGAMAAAVGLESNATPPTQ